MTGLDAHTEQIIMFAWSRILGLPDTTLAEDSGDARIEAENDAAAALSLVQLLGRTVLYGPAPLLEAARSIPDEELALESRLLDIARGHYPGARTQGEAHLLYCEEPLEVHGSDHVSVSFDPEHVHQLTVNCPADDVARSGVTDAEWTAAVVRNGSGEVLSAAGRDIWQEVLGHIGILTQPDHRGLGLGRFAAAVAVEDTLTAGLIPQWRAAAESPGSLRMAISLGFSEIGHQATVALD